MSGRVGKAFRVRVRCHNCRRDSPHELWVPGGIEDAPYTVEELLDSTFLHNHRFKCERCESTIGTVVDASEIERGMAA